jgi:hypothetical protein
MPSIVADQLLCSLSSLQFFVQLQYYKTYHEKEEKRNQSLSSSSILDDSKLSTTMERSVFEGMIEVRHSGEEENGWRRRR